MKPTDNTPMKANRRVLFAAAIVGAAAFTSTITCAEDPLPSWMDDRESHVGRLAHGLDEGPNRGWTIVSMKDDWKTIFPAK